MDTLTPASLQKLTKTAEPAVTLTNVTDDDRTLDNHLLQGMEAELVTTRDELAKAAAHNADVEAELFAVAQRLTAKEAEHEAALNALKKLREELFDARTQLFDARTQLDDARTQLDASTAEVAKRKAAASRSGSSLTERAVRKVIRKVRK